MNSILANILLLVQERIHTEAPAIKWIDQDLGQLEFYTMGQPPVLFPAVLLDFPDAQYSDMGENLQMAESVLEVRLAVAAYTPSAHVHSQAQKEKALEYYNVEHELNKVLHGWCDSRYFSPLSRTSAQTERREDNIRVRLLRYKFALQDNTAMTVAASTVPRPALDLDYQTK